ncbi:MAG TPA: metal-dependent hydrolase [Bacillota bacterium]|nr:metal-dependent hydrolase [Bacillota bacterium]
MKVTFLGHSAFLLVTNQLRLIIDPFLREYPKPTMAPEDVRADYILVSHGHSDHLGDALELAAHSGGTIIANNEIANYCLDHQVSAHGMHLGGAHDFGGFRVKLTAALHGSSLGKNPAQYMGNPAGFILRLDGLTVYHAGDTGLFGDMELLGRLNALDMALLPIGDNYTMGPEDALEAVKLLKPKVVVPMHYNTWPVINQDAGLFKAAVESETGSKVIIMEPGETREF